MKPRPEIKRQAKARLKAQYGLALGTFVVFVLLTGAATGTFVGALLLAPVLTVGLTMFSLKLYRGETADLSNIFDGFKDYGRNLGGILWMGLFVFLWSLLFWIPGIVKGLAYSMTPYILADCPKVRATEALKISMRMTKGYKGEIFVMALSFIGWAFLCALTGGILYILYVGPYMNFSVAGLYEELKKNALAKGVVTEAELG